MTKLEAKIKCDVLKSEGQPLTHITAKLPTAISVLVTDTFNNYLVRDHDRTCRVANAGLGLRALTVSKLL